MEKVLVHMARYAIGLGLMLLGGEVISKVHADVRDHNRRFLEDAVKAKREQADDIEEKA